MPQAGRRLRTRWQGFPVLGAHGAAMDAEGTVRFPPPLNHFHRPAFLRRPLTGQPRAARTSGAPNHACGIYKG